LFHLFAPKRGSPCSRNAKDTIRNYFRLKEIAGEAFTDAAGKTNPKSKDPDFICPHDGHFGDPKDCSKFYR
jgi:hypothetical protein